MSTIINNPTPTEKTVVETDSSGWGVAVLILLVVIGGGIFWYVKYHRGAAAPQQGANINITVPAGSSSY